MKVNRVDYERIKKELKDDLIKDELYEDEYLRVLMNILRDLLFEIHEGKKMRRDPKSWKEVIDERPNYNR